MSQCYCGNDRPFAACCGAVHAGEPAASAEALMRARYAAHVVADIDFIINSTHPQQRHRFDAELTRKWAQESEWLGLEIVAAAEDGDAGQVEFVARYRDRNGLRRHHERAAFVREDGIWFFAGGEIVRPQPATVATKVGRNEPCPCGSGRKAKKCCNA